MASRNKKTTFAKLNREQKLRERRIEKQARKDARKFTGAHGPAMPDAPDDALDGETLDGEIDAVDTETDAVDPS